MADSCIEDCIIERAKQLALLHKDELDYDDPNVPPTVMDEFLGGMMAYCALTNLPLKALLIAFLERPPCEQHYEQAKYEIRQHVVDNR